MAHRLDLYDDKQTWRLLLEDRHLEWQALLNARRRAGCLSACHPRAGGGDSYVAGVERRAIHRFVTQSHSALLGLQPEDWLQMATPVNVPGITDAYPNWRRKLTRDLETLFSGPEIFQLLMTVDRWRGGAAQGTPRIKSGKRPLVGQS